MRPKRSTTFARKSNSSADVTLQSNQSTPGHIAGRRDQIPGVETPKMNLSGILPCSVTSCRTVKINIQLLLAHSRILKKIALIKLKILEFLTEVQIEILLHAFCPTQRTKNQQGFVAYVYHFDRIKLFSAISFFFVQRITNQ